MPWPARMGERTVSNKNGVGGVSRESLFSILVPVASVILALVVGAIIILCLGKNPIQGYALLFSGSLGGVSRIAQTLMSACPLIFTALCASFAYKCGVFNLGGQGQYVMGATCAVIVILSLNLQGPLGILIGLVVGAVVGGIWGLLPGIMKITRGLNEMITSIMLNYVAALFMGWIYTGPFRAGGNPETPAIPDSVMLPRIAKFHVGVILAIALAIVLWYVIFKTSFGFKIRAVGMNPVASKVNGFPVGKLMVLAFIISGAIAGLGGAVEVMGKQYRLLAGFGGNVGFDGVAIALIAQLNPIGSMIVAIFFGMLTTGATSMQVGIMVPTAITSIIRALIIIFAVSGMAALKLPKLKALLQSGALKPVSTVAQADKKDEVKA